MVADRGESGLDEGLGLGSGDECSVTDFEGEPVELTLTEDVGERLVREPTLEQGLEGFDGLGGGWVAAGGDDVDAVEVGGAAVEEFDLEVGFVEVVGAVDLKESIGGGAEQVAEVFGHGALLVGVFGDGALLVGMVGDGALLVGDEAGASMGGASAGALVSSAGVAASRWCMTS